MMVMMIMATRNHLCCDLRLILHVVVAECFLKSRNHPECKISHDLGYTLSVAGGSVHHLHRPDESRGGHHHHCREHWDVQQFCHHTAVTALFCVVGPETYIQ